MLDDPRAQAKIVAGYDLAKLPEADFAPAVELFRRGGQPAGIMALGNALAGRTNASPEVLRKVLSEAVKEWRQMSQAVHAVDVLTKAAGATRQPAVAAELTVLAGRIALEDLRQPDNALALFQQVVQKYSVATTASALRDAQIGIGDVWRAKADYAQAAEAYQKAGPLGEAGYSQQAVRRGNLAQHVEEYLRTDQFIDAQDELDAWQNEFPQDKLEGYLTLMRVRLLDRQQNWRAAADEAESLVAVNPKSNYARSFCWSWPVRILELQQPEKAQAALKRVVKDYPESSLAAEAAKRLGK